MKIYAAGFPVRHIGEPTSETPAPRADALPSVKEAMARAQARHQTELLPSSTTSLNKEPLKQTLRTDGPTFEQWVTGGYPPEKYPPEGYAELQTFALDEYKATGAVVIPKAINDKPTVT